MARGLLTSLITRGPEMQGPPASSSTEKRDDYDLWNQVGVMLEVILGSRPSPTWTGGSCAELPPVGGGCHVVGGGLSHRAAWNFIKRTATSHPAPLVQSECMGEGRW